MTFAQREGLALIQVLGKRLIETGTFMQEKMAEMIRELMKIQGMSIRKISAEIAKEHGGSALGYTQQIHRILNDPAYDPNFSTVAKILSALKCSLWQTNSNCQLKDLEARLDRLDNEMIEIKSTLISLALTLQTIATQLAKE
jgi:hypothetical protein